MYISVTKVPLIFTLGIFKMKVAEGPHVTKVHVVSRDVGKWHMDSEVYYPLHPYTAGAICLGTAPRNSASA